MSLISGNPLLKGVRGLFANLVVFREVRGKIVMANRPKKTGRITPHQQIMKSRFTRASQYAKKQMENEQVKAEYAKGINDRKHSAYAVALTDHMTAPEVTHLDVSKYNGVMDDIITIQATDDFKVMNVHVLVMNDKSEVMEEGEAIQSGSEEWSYRVTTSNTNLSGTKITAHAMDCPGNIGSMEVVIK